MKKSTLLRKVILAVILTLTLASLLTGAIYTVTSRMMFAGIKSAEMLPKARSLARLIAGRGDEAPQVRPLLQFFKNDASMLGGYFAVLDQDGALTAASENLSECVFGLVWSVTTSGAIYLAIPLTPRLTPKGATLSLSQIRTSPSRGSMKNPPSLTS